MGWKTRLARIAALTTLISGPAWAQSASMPGSLMPLGGRVEAWAPVAAPLIARPESVGAIASAVPDGTSVALPLSATGASPLGAAQGGPRARTPNATTRCTPDGQHCISLDSYIPDVCRVIEAAAREYGLDMNFFARLIWRESRFDATAVSHAGAQGIAQFMPGTARERGLSDAFNPAEALFASASLLVDLRADFGNLGLAAAAYNAGGGRVGKFVRGASGLPGETRAYVSAITGFRGVDWRDKKPDPDYRLDRTAPFQTACRNLAEGRGIAAFRKPSAPKDGPEWGAVIAAHRSADIAALRAHRLRRRLPEQLRDKSPTFVPASLPGLRGPQVTAQFGAATEADARKTCRAIERVGLPCVVHRN